MEQVQQPAQCRQNLLLAQISADELKQAMLPALGHCKPLEELIATGEAAFEFVRLTEMDTEAKNAFYRLEMLFGFYKGLVTE